MNIEGNLEERPPVNLISLRTEDYDAFLAKREELIRKESGVGKAELNEVSKSYHSYTLEDFNKRPLLSKIYSGFNAGMRKFKPVLLGGCILGGMTAIMPLASGVSFYPDAVIISSIIGGVIGYFVSDIDRDVKKGQTVNKLISSAQ